MFRLILLLLLYANRCCNSYGYDSGGPDQGACGRAYRSGRMHRPPCDLDGQSYCTSAGTGYPWHAVRRFVRENQGLMRRMYGDQRHDQVLRAELQDEFYDQLADRMQFDNRRKYAKQDQVDDDLDNELYPRHDDNQARYLRDEDISNDDVLNTKFVYSEEPTISIKLADLKTAPHFRPTTSKTTTTAEVPSKETTTDASTVIDVTTDTTTDQNLSQDNEQTTSTTTTTTTTITPSTLNEQDNPTGSDKAETILFQDMDNPNKNKIQIDYQMRGVNACPVKEEVVAPFWANNTRGEVLALLNMYPFEQYVHWEKCTHEHRQMYCRDGCRCEQQYRLHRLLAYDPNNECRGIFSDWFRFPSCCVCKCYSITPAEFRVTSRSPRAHVSSDNMQWYLYKKKMDHG